jgi:hypothetical protein
LFANIDPETPINKKNLLPGFPHILDWIVCCDAANKENGDHTKTRPNQITVEMRTS